jgi:hypothetical protein
VTHIPIPEWLDEMAMLKVLAHVFDQPTFAVARYAFGCGPITKEDLDEYYTPQGFLRIMGLIEERDADLLVLRFGLDGGDPLTYKEIAPMLNPPTSASYANKLGLCAPAALRRVICEELRDKSRAR